MMKNKFLLSFVLATLLFGYFFYKTLFSSIFFSNPERVNIVFYNQETRFYSLGKNNVNYLIQFSNNNKILVPGGYDTYRVGALGKLSALEKNPAIIKNTFSSYTSSFVDLFFYPKQALIYHDDKNSNTTNPSFSEVFLGSSNSNIIDKIYIFLFFLSKDKTQIKIIKNLPLDSNDKDKTYNRDIFSKEIQGSFYKSLFREEKLNVQISYTDSYKTALLISSIMEGEGIRVVDLKQDSSENRGKCLIIEDTKKDFSKTSTTIAAFFNCSLKKGKTELSDIILELGNVERDWLIE